MEQEIELIQLTTADDVSSIKDRLAFMRGRPVLLVWPATGTLLTRKLDLVLIQREAKRLAIRMALVTHDPDVRRNAEELNLSVFETIGGSSRGKWRRGSVRTFTNRSHRPEDAPEAQDLMPVASRVRVESSETPLARALRWLVRVALLMVLLALAASLAYLLIPAAVITITPVSSVVRIEVETWVDPALETLDIDQGIIPALRLRVEVEERGSLPTTGVHQFGGALASGSVVFINKTDQAIDLPADIVVTTSNTPPIFFRTLQSASVPAGVGQQVEVPIEALPNSAGESGNIPAGAISGIVGALADRVEVRNIAPTSGGVSRSVRTVTDDDQASLLATLRQQLQTRAYSDMLPRLNSAQFIIPETIRIVEERSDWTIFDYQIGDAADTLTLTMRAVVEAVGIDETVAQQVAFSRLAAQVPNGWVIRQLDYQRGMASLADESGRLRFSIAAEAQIMAQIDASQIRERLAGQPLSAALDYLRQYADIDSNAALSIVLTPQGMDRLPLLPLRITVQVQEQDGA